MKSLLVVLAAMIGCMLIARSPLGLRIGNEARALSDRMMLGFLRLTSEFEREL